MFSLNFVKWSSRISSSWRRTKKETRKEDEKTIPEIERKNTTRKYGITYRLLHTDKNLYVKWTLDTNIYRQILMEEGQAPTQRRAKHQDILGQLQGPWLRGLKRIGTLLLMAERLTSTCSKMSKFKRSIIFKFLSKVT